MPQPLQQLQQELQCSRLQAMPWAQIPSKFSLSISHWSRLQTCKGRQNAYTGLTQRQPNAFMSRSPPQNSIQTAFDVQIWDRRGAPDILCYTGTGSSAHLAQDLM